MFVAFSFTSAVDLIVSLEEDGFVSGFAEVYVREVRPRPTSGARGEPLRVPSPRMGAAPAPEILGAGVRPEQPGPLGNAGKVLAPTPKSCGVSPPGRASRTCARRTAS